MIETIFILLVVYQVKHFICDFPLQNSYMLGKFKPGLDFILPLMAHASVHAGFTFLISSAFILAHESPTWKGLLFISGLAIFDFVAHFTMDRIKASPKLLGRFKALSGTEYMECLNYLDPNIDRDYSPGEAYKNYLPLKNWQDKIKSNTYFWWALGIDQGVHHLTHYIIIWLLVC